MPSMPLGRKREPQPLRVIHMRDPNAYIREMHMPIGRSGSKYIPGWVSVHECPSDIPMNRWESGIYPTDKLLAKGPVEMTPGYSRAYHELRVHQMICDARMRAIQRAALPGHPIPEHPIEKSPSE